MTPGHSQIAPYVDTTPSDDALRRLALERAGEFAPSPLVIQAIVASVALAFGLAPVDIMGRSRSQAIAEARSVVCLVARRCTRMSFSEIGRALDRDHATVMSAVKRAEARRQRHAWTGSVCSVLFERFGEIDGEEAVKGTRVQ